MFDTSKMNRVKLGLSTNFKLGVLSNYADPFVNSLTSFKHGLSRANFNS
jgi:hypothetical protein